MQPSVNLSSQSKHSDVGPEVLLSLATAPILMGLLASHGLVRILKDLGELSEEAFRGERLPVLTHVPVPEETPQPTT